MRPDAAYEFYTRLPRTRDQMRQIGNKEVLDSLHAVDINSCAVLCSQTVSGYQTDNESYRQISVPPLVLVLVAQKRGDHSA